MPIDDVTVVIPLFNKVPYIERTLHSVLSQTHVPDEIIVIDDGSMDGGGELAERLGAGRVRVERQPNAGVSAARNRGIKLATSAWVALLDADDTWQPDFLRSCMEALRRHPAAVAVFTNFRRDDRGRARLKGMPGHDAVLLDDYFRFASSNRGFGMTASSVVIRRDVLLKVGAFPLGVVRCEDVDTWSRVAWAGPVVYVPEVLVNYYRTPGSVTRTAATSLKPPVDPWQRKVWPADSDIPDSLRVNGQALFRQQLRWHAGLLIETGRKQEARQFLLEQCSPAPFRTDYFFMLLNTFLP